MQRVLSHFLLTAAVAHAGFLVNNVDSEACTARDMVTRALIQSKLAALDPTCEAMCKKIGAYPNCQCPGFNGEAVSSEDTRSCVDSYCKPGVEMCPNDGFVTCVKAKTKASALLQLDDLFARLDRTTASMALGANLSMELSYDIVRRALLQQKVNALVPTCEAMCKNIGAYPNCQCPGFNGEAVSTEDTRSCAGSYCKPGVELCPTDGFVTCVKAKTKVSALLQWDDLMSHFERNTASIQKGMDLSDAHDITRRALLQAKVNALVPTCEAMCKKIGAYPNCQCPGFNGEAVSAEDTRSCAGSYCKPDVEQCPTDGFVTCVKEKTKVSALLQWDDLMSQLDRGMAVLMRAA